MYVLAFFVVVAIAILYVYGRRAKKQEASGTAGGSTPTLAVRDSMPKDFQVYVSDIDPIVPAKHRAEVFKFVRGGGGPIELEREQSSADAPYAIRLVGVASGQRFHIGDVPEGAAKQIVQSGLFESVKARLLRVTAPSDSYIEMRYQIIGPKAEKKKFDDVLLNRPADWDQRTFLKFCGVEVPVNLTFGEASKLVEGTRRRFPDAAEAWQAFERICERFEDAEIRKSEGIRRVNKKLLYKALQELQGENKSYAYLLDHLPDVARKLKEMDPDLIRKH